MTQHPRILAISNFFPPYYLGGYELGCADVLQQLRQRGYAIGVLTSMHGMNRPTVQDQIYRLLVLDVQPQTAPASDTRTVRIRRQAARVARLLIQTQHNYRAVQHAVRAVRPDLIYVWGMWALSHAVISAAHATGCPVYAFVSDYWLAHRHTDAWVKLITAGGLPQLVSSALPDRVQFPSAFLAAATRGQAGAMPAYTVIPWGIDPALLVPRGPAAPTGQPLRLLYVGRMERYKGVHTAIAAVQQALPPSDPTALHLTLAGDGLDAAYQRELEDLVQHAGLQAQVTFLGKVARSEIMALYRTHDALIFPSIWGEPFSITLLEAMAHGLAIIGTLSGGSREILVDGHNALIFDADDTAGCAACIRRMAADHTLRARLAQTAQDTIATGYTLPHMIDRIEADLLHPAADTAAVLPAVLAHSGAVREIP